MPRRSPPPSEASAAAPPAGPVEAPPPSRYRITHYGPSRHWALYDGDDLLAVTVYRRGALAVKERLEALEHLRAGSGPVRAPALPPATVSEAPGPAVQAVQQRRHATPEDQAAMVLALVQGCRDDPTQLAEALVRHFRVMTARLR